MGIQESTSPREVADRLSELRHRLAQLHLHAGEPSSRTISRETGKAISHTTVNGVLRCARLPTWGQLELVVEHLGGDIEEFRLLWVAVRHSQRISSPRATAVDIDEADDGNQEPELKPKRPHQADPLYYLEAVGPPQSGPVLAITMRSTGGLVSATARHGVTQFLQHSINPERHLAASSDTFPAVQPPTSHLSAIGACHGRALLAGADSKGRIHLWNPRIGEALAQPLAGHDGEVLALAFDAPGTLLVSSGVDRTVRLWSLREASNVWTVQHESEPHCVSISHSGEFVAAGDSTGKVAIWTGIDPPSCKVFQGPTHSAVHALAFSPTGPLLAAGHDDGTIHVWPAHESSTPIGPIRAHNGATLSLAFHPTEELLASGGSDGHIRIWDLPSGVAEGASLTQHNQSVTALAFHATGRFLASGDAAGSSALWHRRSPERRNGPASSEQIARVVESFLDDVVFGARAMRRVPTSFSDLDLILGGGLGSGDLIVIAGHPSMGKSVFALDLLRSAAVRHNIPAFLLSIDMSKADIMQRYLSAEARVPLHVIRSGVFSEDDWARVSKRLAQITEVPLFVDDKTPDGVDEVAERIARAVQEDGVRLAVVDGTHHLFSRDGTSPLPGLPRQAGQALKAAARDLQIPVVAVVPLGPDVEATEGHPPVFEDVRADIGIDDAADVVIVLHRDDYYNAESGRAGEADLIVAKHRNGPTDILTVASQLHFGRMVDMATYG